MKPSMLKPAGLLKPLETPSYPWESISTDFITCLPVTSKGNDTLAVWVDRLTKYVVLHPCTLTLNAVDFAQLTVDHVISKHGVPESMVRGRNVWYTAEFITHIFLILTCERKMSSAFHPQIDGQTGHMDRRVEETI